MAEAVQPPAGDADQDPEAPAPWLSVLIPVHNVEPYLSTCVASVMAGVQALPAAVGAGVEVLLLDDGSTDGSARVMQTLQRCWAPRLQALGLDRNRGVAAARNALLDRARGRHLWFVDGDDWIEPAALPRLHALLQDPAAPDVVFFDYRIERGTASAFRRLRQRLRGEGHRRTLRAPPRRPLPGGAPLVAAALATGDLFMWSQVSRRSLWGDDLRFPEGRTFEDQATLPRLLLRAGSAWHEPRAWVHYRRRDDSVTGVMSEPKLRDLAAALVPLCRELRAQAENGGDAGPRDLRFRVAHQAARNLIAALRHARRLDPAVAAVVSAQARRDFVAALGGDLRLLWQGYLRRAWLWRAWRLRLALRDPVR